jgi:hypothetical protein
VKVRGTELNNDYRHYCHHSLLYILLLFGQKWLENEPKQAAAVLKKATWASKRRLEDIF